MKLDENQPLSSDPTVSLISVIIPIHQTNEEAYRAIDSVLNQSYPNIELIIIDSSGSDRLAEFANLNRVVYEYQKPNGVSVARNRGVELASGKYISFLDADDKFEEKKLTKQIELIKSENAEVCYTDIIEHNNNRTSRRGAMPVSDPDNHDLRFFVEDGRLGNIATSSLVFTREVIINKRFNTSLPVKEDYHLWVRIFRQGRVVHLEQALTHVWLREESLSSDAEAMYTYGVEAARDLADHDSRYEPLLSTRIAVERYGYGRQLLLERKDVAAARAVFYQSIISDQYYRAMVPIILSFLPVSINAVMNKLDWVRHWIVTHL